MADDVYDAAEYRAYTEAMRARAGERQGMADEDRCYAQPADTGVRCPRRAEFDVKDAGDETEVAVCAAHLTEAVRAVTGESLRGAAVVTDHVHPVPHCG